MKIIIICSIFFLILTALTKTHADEIGNTIKAFDESISMGWKTNDANVQKSKDSYLKLSKLMGTSKNREKLRIFIINRSKNDSLTGLLLDLLKQSSKEEFIVFVKSLYRNKNYPLTKICLTSLYPIWVNPSSGTEKQKNEIYDLMIKLAKSDNFPLSFRAINLLLGDNESNANALKSMNKKKGIAILKAKVEQNLPFKEKIKCYELLVSFNIMGKEYCHYLINIIFGDYPSDKIEAKLRLLKLLN